MVKYYETLYVLQPTYVCFNVVNDVLIKYDRGEAP